MKSAKYSLLALSLLAGTSVYAVPAPVKGLDKGESSTATTANQSTQLATNKNTSIATTVQNNQQNAKVIYDLQIPSIS